jgi:GT2 family glycosyltransferase
LRLKAAGHDVIVVGTHHDRSEENWEDDFVSRFHSSLPELAALIDHSKLHIGNDSGVGHLAAAVGVPGLMLYGPSDPIKNAPNSCVMQMLVAGDRDIASITVDEVWNRVQQLLQDPQRDPERELPERATDSVEARWQHYVTMTQAQPIPETQMRGQSPAGGVPKVSVIIPTYNRGENAVRAMKSALAQTEQSLEVLVIDDGSTDDTPKLFENPPERVRYFRKPNGGASSARNVGLRNAQGEWIALLDSDDEWAPDKLEKQLNALGTHFVAAACRHVHINVNGSRQEKPQVLPGADQHLFRDLYEDLSLKTSSLVLKRHLLERVGLFNERFPVSNDWDFFLRVAKVVNNSGFVCLPDALVTVHRSGDSLSKTARANALEEAFTRICMVNALLHADDPEATQRHIQRAGRKHLELSRAYRKQGDKAAAKQHAREAMRAGLKLKGFWKLVQAL